MPNDPNLHDTCISIRDGSPYWYMSPDIELKDPAGTLDQAETGGNNTVRVRVQRLVGCSFTPTLPGNPTNILYEVWACVPGPTPPNPLSNSTQIASGLIPVASVVAGGANNWSSPVTWTPTSTSTGDPDGPGHKCLIARVWPDLDGTPDAGDFHCPDDPHVAQLNIAIVQVQKREMRMARFDTRTNGRDPEKPERVIMRAVEDLRPDPKEIEILMPRLQQVPGFKHIANKPLGGFSMQFKDLPDVKVRDNTRPGCLSSLLGAGGGFQPSYEAEYQLAAGQVASFTFLADITGATEGDAHLFQLLHVGEDRQVYGGLTLGFVVV